MRSRCDEAKRNRAHPPQPADDGGSTPPANYMVRTVRVDIDCDTIEETAGVAVPPPPEHVANSEVFSPLPLRGRFMDLELLLYGQMPALNRSRCDEK